MSTQVKRHWTRTAWRCVVGGVLLGLVIGWTAGWKDHAGVTPEPNRADGQSLRRAETEGFAGGSVPASDGDDVESSLLPDRDLSDAPAQSAVRAPVTFAAGAHVPTQNEKSLYRSLRLRAKAVGVDLPREFNGSKALWTDIGHVSDAFSTDISAAKHARSQRLMRVASTKQPEERVGNPGEVVKTARTGSAALSGGASVFSSNNEGVYRIQVRGGEDPELDRLDETLRSLSLECAEALQHVLKSHGVTK